MGTVSSMLYLKGLNSVSNELCSGYFICYK